MKALEKIELLDKVGRELQSRMTFAEIDQYFGVYGIDCKDLVPSANSKWVYVKEVLADVEEDMLLKIADELSIIEYGHTNRSFPEATFWRPGQFRLFLSHLASFKTQTAKLQQVLKKYSITSFVAHEDIEPSKEWQNEIETALHTMDAMATLLMPGFKESNWCDQEIGVAVARDVLILPIRKGLDPYGFIGKYQGIQAKGKTIAQVGDEVFQTIIKSPKTRSKMIRSLTTSISQATDIEEAIEKVNLLQSIENLPIDLLENMREAVTENNLLINSIKFIVKLNILLVDYSIERLKVGEAAKPDWDDDIPF